MPGPKTTLLTTLLTLLSTTPLTTALPPALPTNLGGIRLCTEPNYAGNCWYGIMPLDDCIALNSFAGKVLSFRPDEGTECFLMQGRCNSDDQFASFESDSELSADLTRFDWIKDAESFICMEEREVAH
ncbi:hypothetical protein WHR41_03684 [Cladosporium halotolerans]|uniref:Uncharacterized protein n=1 Tax=Cladosporium halotolerans TaxID=1052096 RepID=A0AB34KUL5_9PEZI